jgi:hypothetical protein
MPTGSGSGLNRNDREGALHRAWGLIFTNQIRGAYYEFGVYRGDTFRISHRVCQGYSSWQQDELVSDENWRQVVAKDYATFRHEFYAFDSFTGIPENDERNLTFGSGTFACSLQEFDKLNREQGIIEGNGVRYFEGYFDEIGRRDAETIKELQPAAIVNLDCDLYVSAVDALAMVKPKLVQGTILLADDWNTFSADKNAGERKAVAEFLIANPNIQLEPWFPYLYAGQAFLVHVS